MPVSGLHFRKLFRPLHQSAIRTNLGSGKFFFGFSHLPDQFIVDLQLFRCHQEVAEKLPNHLLIVGWPHTYLASAPVGRDKGIFRRNSRSGDQLSGYRIFNQPAEVKPDRRLQNRIHSL